MYHVGILYAPYDDVCRSIIDIIRNSIDSNDYDIRVKKAAEAAMPDIAASDIIIFVSSGNAEKPVHEDYTEIIRALSGINLSGRIVGLVVFNTDETKHYFETVLKNTGAACYEDVLNIEKENVDKGKIMKWAGDLLQEYERIIYDRG